MKEYNHKKIEKKWQKDWRQKGVYKAKNTNNKKSFYILDMFPYPSGDGLHVGHPRGYLATDIFSRFKRMQGFNVLHPMGWDAFGLPAEQYAIKNKTHPKKAVEKNIKRYKEQLSILGPDYDWSKEINTTDPDFYKWTQWAFLQMFKNNLAYQSNEPINWCPSCKTGLANEDLDEGRCERCGSEIERKPIRQWVLKITDYANRLLGDLDGLDWPKSVKESQKNWVGRSSGVEIRFPVNVKNNYVFIHGFKSSSKHNFWPWLKKELEQKGCKVQTLDLPDADNPDVNNQIEYALNNIEVDDKTVVIGHSLGSIVALKVCQRLKTRISKLVLVGGFIKPNFKDKKKRHFVETFDWKFDAKKIKRNVGKIEILRDVRDDVIPYGQAESIKEGFGGQIIDAKAKTPHFKNSKEPSVLDACLDEIDTFTTRPETVFGATYIVLAPEHQLVENLSYKIENKEELDKYVKKAAKRTELQRADKNRPKTGVKLKGVRAINPATNKEIDIWVADYVLSDYGGGAIMAVPAHDQRDYEFAREYNLPVKKVITPSKEAEKDFSDEEVFAGAGKLVNSGKFTGQNSDKAKNDIIKFVDAEKRDSYKLRDWVFSRQRYWGEPIPIIHCYDCGPVPVPEKDLPVKLPNVKSYEPTGTGESPLASVKSWVNVKCPECGLSAKRETNTMPQWAGSSWYYLRFIDPTNSKKMVDKKKEEKWSPVDLYVGGTEHATRHLIYARFWHKFLYDIGVVNFEEPFSKLKNQGMILAEDGRKMSKRWGNVVNPDDIVDRFGADSFRLYEMFMGPFDQMVAWNTNGVVGVRRFLEKVWKISQKDFSSSTDNQTQSILHKTIKKVTEDIESFNLNTAVSQMMILVNQIEEKGISKGDFLKFVKLLAPFAPHLTEEINQNLGRKKSIHILSWPEFDHEKTIEDKVKLPVQVNGKVRQTIEVDKKISRQEIEEMVLNLEKVKKELVDKKIKKLIYIPEKIVNVVV